MIRQFITYALTLALGSGMAMAQSGSAVRRADKAAENLNYPKAERLYQLAVKKGGGPEVSGKLARLLAATGRPDLAVPVFASALQGANPDTELQLAYAKALQSSGQYANASKWYRAYATKGDFPDDARRNAQICDELLQKSSQPSSFEVRTMPFNTPASDMGAIAQGGNWLIASNQRRGFAAHPLDPVTGRNCYDIYELSPDAKRGYRRQLLPGAINSRFHDGPCTAPTTDGLIYFTRSNFVKGRYARDGQGYNHLQVMSARLKGRKWKDLQVLPFNDRQFSCGHPSLSADGQSLFFASDMPGGYGGSDLYLVRKQGESWGKPQNLGQSVNTDGDELFPFIHRNGTLYFASNGRPGLGGLDLYRSKEVDELREDAVNLGAPLNSAADDFAMYWDRNGRTGLLTSDRVAGAGSDDIYRFEQKVWVELEALSGQDGQPLAGATVKAIGSKGGVQQLKTDAQGKIGFFANGTEDYKLSVQADWHEPAEWMASVGSADDQGQLKGRLSLTPIPHILGTVVADADNAPISGARVRIFSSTGQTEQQSDAQGGFAVKVSPETNYQLVVTKPGFKPEILDLGSDLAASPVTPAQLRLKTGAYTLVIGEVQELNSGLPLADIKIRALDSTETQVLKQLRSNALGKFNLVLPQMPQTFILGTHPDYFVSRASLQSPVVAEDEQSVVLKMVPSKVGEVVKTIYFDYKSAAIKHDFNAELNEIVFFMEDNPGMSLEIGSHTDSRGSNESNQLLSEQRAAASRDYIVQKKIDPKRVTSKGYGETQLTNGCNDTTPCEEAAHSPNRRSEFKVTKIESNQ